jgi:hypothetical protein
MTVNRVGARPFWAKKREKEGSKAFFGTSLEWLNGAKKEGKRTNDFYSM